MLRLRTFSILELYADRREPDYVIGAGGDADSGFVQRGQNVAAHLVLEPANLMRMSEEAQAELDPIIGQAIIDRRLHFVGFDVIAALQFLEFMRAEIGD
jgi:hypothetical protein